MSVLLIKSDKGGVFEFASRGQASHSRASSRFVRADVKIDWVVLIGKMFFGGFAGVGARCHPKRTYKSFVEDEQTRFKKRLI